MDAIFKLFTAVRGGSREAMETVIDANAIRILAQEIHESEAAVARARQDLTRVVAEKLRLSREMAATEAALSGQEARVTEALRDEQQDVAREYAAWIADNEPVLEDLRDKHRTLEAYEADLKRSLQAVIRSIENYRRELRMARATESSHSATRRIAHSANHLGSRLDEMGDTLRRIKRRQDDFVDHMAAREDVERSLDSAMTGPGGQGCVPKVDAEAVLQRIRRKNAL